MTTARRTRRKGSYYKSGKPPLALAGKGSLVAPEKKKKAVERHRALKKREDLIKGAIADSLKKADRVLSSKEQLEVKLQDSFDNIHEVEMLSRQQFELEYERAHSMFPQADILPEDLDENNITMAMAVDTRRKSHVNKIIETYADRLTKLSDAKRKLFMAMFPTTLKAAITQELEDNSVAQKITFEDMIEALQKDVKIDNGTK